MDLFKFYDKIVMSLDVRIVTLDMLVKRSPTSVFLQTINMFVSMKMS